MYNKISVSLECVNIITKCATCGQKRSRYYVFGSKWEIRNFGKHVVIFKFINQFLNFQKQHIENYLLLHNQSIWPHV